MKIICVGNNHKNYNKELYSNSNRLPLFFLKPESALLRNEMFFLPDFSNEIQCEIDLVIRISRLGRHIDAKFAHRYFDTIGLGINFTAKDVLNECVKEGLPWEIAKSFDGSVILSKFVNISNFQNLNDISFFLKKNNRIIQNLNTSDMIFNYYEIIELISKYMTLKIGDLIFIGINGGVDLAKAHDEYKGFLNGKEMLGVKVR